MARDSEAYGRCISAQAQSCGDASAWGCMGRMGVEAHEHLGSNRKCAGGHIRQSHNGMAWGMGHGPHGQVRGGCVSFSCAVTLAADSPELWHSPLGQTTCVWRDARCMGRMPHE